jgi:PAS domain S-box-containing protein
MEKPKTTKELQSEIGKLEAKVTGLESAVVELKLNTESLQKNESNLLSLLRSMVDLVFVIGLDGSFARYYQDPNREDLFLPPKQFLGKSVREVFPAELADVFQKAINAVETYGQTQAFDFFMPIKKREYWFNARISLYKPASGEFLGYLCEMCNITERKRMEEALRVSEERYRAVMQQSMLCIFLADIDTRVIVDANQAMQRLLGYTREELSGLSLYDFLEKEKGDIYRKVLQVLKERSYYMGERRFRRKDGSAVEVEMSVNLIGYRGKEVMCVVARDISPRRLAERQLRPGAGGTTKRSP